MSNIITRHIYCPLCQAPFKRRQMMYGQMRVEAYICTPCNIFTFSFDPAFNKWRDSNKTIPCPNCNHRKVDWFSRQLDNYMKFRCPKCKIVGAGDCNSVIKDDGSVDLELMEGSEQVPEENSVEIPVDKLNLAPDVKAKLKHKLKKKRED